MFLASAKKCRHAVYTYGNIRGLAIYKDDSIVSLASRAKELAIDASYGTNNSIIFSLYAVLSELDGIGVPLGYLVAVSAIDHAPISVVAGAKTNVLEQILKPIKAANFDPFFFGCDNDMTEIGAIQKVWPDVSVQLCYWHSNRGIQTKLKDNRTRTQSHYYPGEAKVLVPVLDVCWGSHPVRRPSSHRNGFFQCISSRMGFSELGSIETNTKGERHVVLRMFSRHYNLHPMIPDLSGTYRSTGWIHSDSENDVYLWC